MVEMVIGGARFRLDPAAISAVRYRCAYGRSIVTDLAGCRTVREAEGKLLRMCRLMIPEGERPELLDFARLAGRDRDFFGKGEAARAALLAVDESAPLPLEGEAEPFDEYNILAMMTAVRMDMGLLYELPIMHIAGVLHLTFGLQDPERKRVRPMTHEESCILYPRPQKKTAPMGGQN